MTPHKFGKVLSWGSDVEDATIEQAAKASRMPFVKGHLALMPDAHIGMGATIGSVIPTEGAIIPAAVGVDIGCFRGDTKVPLLNGRQKTLKEMAEAGGEWWVYSLDADQIIVPGRAVATRTRANAALIKVTVSGGEEIVCTPDHPFMLRDGTYKEAQELRFNESLMPLYRRWQTRDGYESSSTGHGDSELTHLRVYEALHGAVTEGHLVHHKDHCHFNNDPSNLESVLIGEHSRYHRQTGHSFRNGSPEFQRLRREGIARGNQKPERQRQLVEVGTRNITTHMTEHPDEWKASVAGNGKRGAPYLALFNVTPRVCDECEEVQANPGALFWHKKREHGHNHKVIAVEVLEEKEDVYCLQVEDHHNFALAAGVFVHNCGMIAVETNLHQDQLPDTLDPLLVDIESVVPSGVGKGHTFGTDWDRERHTRKVPSYSGSTSLTGKQINTITDQFGTLGSGNHFVEVCLDERDHVWVVLHSGSRGIGNQLASTHIKGAKGLMKARMISLEDPDLAYLVEGEPTFQAYILDMLWAQEYAMANREAMMDAVLTELWKNVPATVAEVQRVNCHHNFTIRENHNGRNVWITRKGAIRARTGDKGVIPGSMGTRSYIVTGLGNASSYNSCSHGAGRRLSRTAAKRELSVESLRVAMGDRTWNQGHAEALLDEHPDSYKDIDQVMADQADLVTIEHTLHSILNYKGQ